MRKPSLGRERTVDFNVTPMIDVVFLLIIFFLVSSYLASQETQLELALPEADSRIQRPQQAPSEVTINVAADGELLLGGDAATVEQIGQRLTFERKRAGDDLQVRIRADRAVPYGRVQPLLLACAKAGVWNVAFAVKNEELARP